MTEILKGKNVAEEIDKKTVEAANKMYKQNIVPTLAIVRVGSNSSDVAYENNAVNKAKKLGIQVEKFIANEDIEEDDLIEVLKAINNNSSIHGVLLLRPLPPHLDENRIRNTVDITKDLDCISDKALAKVFNGKTSFFAPCTAEACVEILKYYQIPVYGKKAVVIGRSMVIGKPVAMLLLDENATVTVCHTKTPKKDLIDYCKSADIIVVASGHMKTFTEEMATDRQTIIDVGINFDEKGNMCGDVDFDGVSDIVSSVTPVPGGVGSVTTSLLMWHLVQYYY